MKTSSEVNFEKRGKLTDHQTCQICGACLCDGHTHHTRLLKLFFLLLYIAFVLGSLKTLAFGAEIPYTYQVTTFAAEDLNIHSDLVGLNGAVALKKAKGREIDFNCTGAGDDIQARRLNNKGDAAGSCLVAGRNKEVGFIRSKLGLIDLIDIPNTDGVAIHAIADNRKVCGQYFTPFAHPLDSGFTRFHGFCQSALGITQTIDVPLPDHSVTIITGVNSRSGKKIGNYFTFDPITNETSQVHCFQLDNGNFSSLERPGAAWSYCSDINRDDTVLYEDDADVFLLDDGVYFKISDPTPTPGFNLLQVDVKGFNDALQIVGSWREQGPCDTTVHPPFCPQVTKNFIATPQ